MNYTRNAFQQKDKNDVHAYPASFNLKEYNSIDSLELVNISMTQRNQKFG